MVSTSNFNIKRFFLFRRRMKAQILGKCTALVTKYKSRNLILKIASEFNFFALWFTWALVYTFWIWLPVLFLLFIFTFLVVNAVQLSLHLDWLFFNLSSLFVFNLNVLIGRLKFGKGHFYTRCSRLFWLVWYVFAPYMVVLG